MFLQKSQEKDNNQSGVIVRRCSSKQVFLKILQISQVNTCVGARKFGWSLFLIKLWPATLLKRGCTKTMFPPIPIHSPRLPSTLTHFHTLSSTLTYSHRFPPTPTHCHPLPPTPIYSHPFPSTPIHYDSLLLQLTEQILTL